MTSLRSRRRSGVVDVASVTVPMPRPPVRSVEITGATWEFLDQADLGDVFVQPFLVLKQCPRFFSGRLRFCFFRGFARKPSCAVGKGSCGGESGLEAFRSGAHHALAQTLTHRKRGSGRLVAWSRRVRQRQVGRFVERCPSVNPGGQHMVTTTTHAGEQQHRVEFRGGKCLEGVTS